MLNVTITQMGGTHNWELKIQTDENFKVVELSESDFNRLFLAPKAKAPIVPQEFTLVSAAVEANFEGQESPAAPNISSQRLSNEQFGDFLNHLQALGINLLEIVTNDSDRTLIIVSESDSVLSASWESLRSSNLPPDQILNIQREVIKVENCSEKAYGQNSIFMLSHGYIDGENKMRKVAQDFESEVSPALANSYLSNRGGNSLAQIFTIFRFLNEPNFKSLDLSPYNNLHFLSHGSERGEVGFENSTEFSKIKWIEADSFVELLPKVRRELIFLSCCYSGSAAHEGTSLAYRLVKNGLAKNVVAFSGGLGSEYTLPRFVTGFYSTYLRTFDAKGAFNDGLRHLSSKQKTYIDRPVLYVSSAQ
jgi:hypothetical protein